jgi:hypothetical protein
VPRAVRKGHEIGGRKKKDNQLGRKKAKLKERGENEKD